MDYILHVLVLSGIYTVLSVSLNLLAGRTGLLSIAHAAFYGLGAYTSSLLAVRCGMPFIVGAVVGMAVAVLISFIVSFPSLRLHADYFVIATFGFQMILVSVFNNWMEVTRGPLGIPGIPRPVIFGWHVNSHLDFLILATAFACFAYFAVYRITSSPFGRVLHAIREDEGKNGDDAPARGDFLAEPVLGDCWHACEFLSGRVMVKASVLGLIECDGPTPTPPKDNKAVRSIVPVRAEIAWPFAAALMGQQPGSIFSNSFLGAHAGRLPWSPDADAPTANELVKRAEGSLFKVGGLRVSLADNATQVGCF